MSAPSVLFDAPGPRARAQNPALAGFSMPRAAGTPGTFETGPLFPASEFATASPAAAALERRVAAEIGSRCLREPERA